MKKNEKNFMQNEADLEKVAGGSSMASGVEVGVDVEASIETKIDNHSKTVDLRGGVSGNVGGGINIDM